MPFDQTNRIAVVNTPYGKDEIGLLSLTGTEVLSAAPRFELTLISEQKTLDPNKILGQTVSVTLNTPKGHKRYFHGHVIHFGRAGMADRYHAYRATVVPWIWFLSLTTNCRVFQNKTVPDIVQQVCKEYGFDRIELRLKETYTPWEYCTQYRETDLNFISRLMQQEGICYFIKHEASQHTLVLADSAASHQPFGGYSEIKLRRLNPAGDEDREHIREFIAQMNHVAGAFVHTDYDFERPRTNLLSRSELPGAYTHANFEVYDYPGEYVQYGDGETWSRARMEEIHAQMEQASGKTDSWGIVPGSVFSLAESPYAEENRQYLVTSAEYEVHPSEFESGRGASNQLFECRFTVQPVDKQFRPVRTNSKPKTFGVQTAVVVGPQGEEIYTDKYGRIKVQFHWDREGKRDENSSCWVRVAQAWAGRRWGANFIPRVGQEVIVDFLEGDPDQPIVIGTVYNGDQMPPYLGQGLDSKHAHDPNVSGIKSCSTKGGGGFNELRFDDTKGNEQVFVHAEKDFDLRAKNNHRTVVQKNRYQKVGSGSYKEKISSDGSHHVSSAVDFAYKTKKIVLTADLEVHVKAGGSFIKLGPDGIYISGPMVYINSGGSADSADEVSDDSDLDPDPTNNSKPGSPSC